VAISLPLADDRTLILNVAASILQMPLGLREFS